MSDANNEIQKVILQELRDFRQETRDKLDNHGNRISVVETKLYPLTGNGQRGKIAEIEDSIDDLKRWRYYFTGAVAILVEGFHFAAHKLFGGN